jgi:ankyrin repeat protein
MLNYIDITRIVSDHISFSREQFVHLQKSLDCDQMLKTLIGFYPILDFEEKYAQSVVCFPDEILHPNPVSEEFFVTLCAHYRERLIGSFFDHKKIQEPSPLFQTLYYAVKKKNQDFFANPNTPVEEKIALLAAESGLSQEHLNLLISLTKNGLNTFDQIRNDHAQFKIMRWERAKELFGIIKYQLLEISQKILSCYPNYYFRHFYLNDQLKTKLRDHLKYFNDLNYSINIPDWICAELVEEQLFNVISIKKMMLICAQDGYAKTADKILSVVPNFDINNQIFLNKQSLLHIAVNHGHVNVAQVLLKHHALLTLKNSYKITPLYLAVKKGHKEMVDLLLRYKPPIDQKNNFDPETVLYLAVREQSLPMIELILEHIKNNIDQKNQNIGYTALHLAVKLKKHDVVKLLLTFGASLEKRVDYPQCTAFHLAIEYADSEMLRLLCSQSAHNFLKVKMNQSLLELAVSKEQHDMIDILIEHKAPIRYALHKAVSLGNLRMVQQLAHLGTIFQRNDRGDTPIDIAIKMFQVNILEYLLSIASQISWLNSKESLYTKKLAQEMLNNNKSQKNYQDAHVIFKAVVLSDLKSKHPNILLFNKNREIRSDTHYRYL